jgi:uncharacterized membrane protein
MKDDPASNAATLKWCAILEGLLMVLMALVVSFTAHGKVSIYGWAQRVMFPIMTLLPLVAAKKGWDLTARAEFATSSPSSGVAISNAISVMLIISYAVFLAGMESYKWAL